MTSPRDPSGAWVLNPSLSKPADEQDAVSLVPSELPAQNLVIRVTDNAVIFYDEDGLRRMYPFSRRTTWDGATLRIERPAAHNTTVIQLYSVDPNERRLTVTIVIDQHGATNARRIRYVYDPLH